MKTFEVAFDSGKKFNFYLNEKKDLDCFSEYFGKHVSINEVDYTSYDNVSIIKNGVAIPIDSDNPEIINFINENIEKSETINNCYFLNYEQ